jgi:hypothetical protein
MLGAVLIATCLTAQPSSEPPPTPVVAPAPYSLPFQLRPTAVVTAVRSDSTFAVHELPDGFRANTVVSFLLGAVRLSPHLGAFVRVGAIHNGIDGRSSGTAITNPAFGGNYVLILSDRIRLAFFATSDFVAFPGVDWSYQASGFTVQFESSLFLLKRMKGDLAHPDASRTNFTSGAHAGYFIDEHVSVAAELRYQRWVTTPTTIAANEALRDTLNAALGARLHFKWGDGHWVRPGLAFTRGLDSPMTDGDYSLVQLDVPVVF